MTYLIENGLSFSTEAYKELVFLTGRGRSILGQEEVGRWGPGGRYVMPKAASAYHNLAANQGNHDLRMDV